MNLLDEDTIEKFEELINEVVYQEVRKMSVSKVNINGVELELNLLDADVIEKFEGALADVQRKIQDPKAYEGKTTAEGMRYQCRCVEEYFDTLFGNGTSEKVFPKNNDLGIRMDAFGQVTALSGTIKPQINTIQKEHRIVRVDVRPRKRKTKIISVPLITANEYACGLTSRDSRDRR